MPLTIQVAEIPTVSVTAPPFVKQTRLWVMGKHMGSAIAGSWLEPSYIATTQSPKTELFNRKTTAIEPRPTLSLHIPSLTLHIQSGRDVALHLESIAPINAKKFIKDQK